MSNFASVEAEQAVLGSMLIDSGCVRRVAAILRESDFSVALNQDLYRVIVTMDRDGQPIDGLTVCAEALRQSLAEEKTLRKYLAQLMEITPTAANVEMYADIVARTARRRELKTALEDGLAALADQAPEDEVLTQLDAAMTASSQRLESELLAPKEQVDGFLDYRTQIDEGNIPYVRTGIKALDKLLGGGRMDCTSWRAAPVWARAPWASALRSMWPRRWARWIISPWRCPGSRSWQGGCPA